MAATKSTKKPAAKKTPKPAAKRAKPAAKKTAPAAQPPAAPEVGDLAKAGAVLAHLRAQRPPLSSGRREAFRALATDAQRSQRGKQTKAENVLVEAVRWAVQMDADLRAHPEILEVYSESRFAYYLECATALQQRLSSEQAKRRAQDEKVGDAASGREVALKARKKLLRRAERYAGKREDILAEIRAAIGTVDTDANLAVSCVELAAFARRHIARKDDISKHLVREAGLTEALAVKAEEAGKALTEKSAGATLAGRRAGKDSPLVNREEGGVLLEMEHAMDAFAEAHEDNDAVQRLSPGPSVRHALGFRKPGGKQTEPGEDETEGSDADEGAQPEPDAEEEAEEPEDEDEAEEAEEVEEEPA